MKKYFYSISLLLGLLLSLQGCEKPKADPIIPPLASRMYGYLDGVNWVLPNYSAVYFKQSNILTITASTSNGYRLYFHIHTTLQDGVIPINKNTGRNVVTMTYDIGSDHFDYYSYAGGNMEGEIELKGMDVANRAINGKFSVRLVNPTTGQARVIAGGVFQNIAYKEVGNEATGVYLPKVNGNTWLPQTTFISKWEKNFLINMTDVQTGQHLSLLLPNNLGTGKYPMRVLGDIMGIYRPDFNHTQFSFSPQDTLFIDSHDFEAKNIQGHLMMQTQDFSGQSANTTHTANFALTYW
ncbi:MAG: hypothetical protein ACKVTZ_16595 [Bacteroidia bacterium]